MDRRRGTKSRVKTGCRTCRVRRIKCDEARPECLRCRSSNVQCLGYAERRRIAPNSSASEPALRTQQDVPSACRTSADASGSPPSSLLPTLHQPGSLPLIGLPSNPRPDQRPHHSARHILAYHQFVFRTVSIISPPIHLSFWRDHLCGKAWELEYVYDAIIALGTVHRAVILMSGKGRTDAMRGRDTAVVAAQAYIEALEKLARVFEDQLADSITVAVLLLLALFECFAGNVTAAYRHVQVANRLYASLATSETSANPSWSAPITNCLGTLSHTCRITVPLRGLEVDVSFADADDGAESTALERPLACAIHLNSTCTCHALRQLMEILSSTPEIESLVWTPLGLTIGSLSLDKTSALKEQINGWMYNHTTLDSQLQPEDRSASGTNLDARPFDSFPIPPEPFTVTSADVSLLGATCELSLARIEWLSCILDHGNRSHEYQAYLHCYRSMRWVETAVQTLRSVEDHTGVLLPCERIHVGFSSLLFLLGQMCPNSTWLTWIIQQTRAMGREGLVDGEILAQSLGAIPIFEMCNKLDTPALLKSFSSPSSRCLCVVLPISGGQGHIAYYAQPEPAGDQATGGERSRYHPVGSVSWAQQPDESGRKPQLFFYNTAEESEVQFNQKWLRSQDVGTRWLEQDTTWEFSFDLALAAHRSTGIPSYISNLSNGENV